MSKEMIRDFILNHDEILKNRDITCGELVGLKDKFYTECMKKPRITEAIVLRWIHYYLGIDQALYENEVVKGNIILRSEKKYVAEIGRQTLDISILSGYELKIGISIKVSSSTSAYLDGADFSNPIIKRYREKFVKSNEEYNRKYQLGKRIGVPTLLQDIARIENIQNALANRFEAVTIIFEGKKPKDEFWISEFEHLFNHKYIFIADTPAEKFREEIVSKIPSFVGLGNE
ncbi:hypothetical protein KZ483_26080 [Paenibacillus sp. sptzw28]|uniref:hypothetical protein n=1 Tax=Paenibacillus sp. sptzw28 TaxID=715179 RepID=UPI001C6E2EFE|nr:hypothetical protein [Paenibacillus sp. sptzw28]QYR21136.1 hypothetical protein KZ483_26080 [Paenibacillus sp. sptzw28]